MPVTFTSTSSTGVASYRSSAFPAGAVFGCPLISAMSSRTTSPSSLATAKWAAVAPTFPAPMMLILARRMRRSFVTGCRPDATGVENYPATAG